MRAVVYDRYGGPDVLHIEDVEKPLPKEDEVLVRIYAVAVTRADCATRQANRRSGRGFELVSRAIFGLRRPRQPILGGDFLGRGRGCGIGGQGVRGRRRGRPDWAF